MSQPLTIEEKRLVAEAVAAGRARRIEWADLDPAAKDPAYKFKLGVGKEFYETRCRVIVAQGLDPLQSPMLQIAEVLNVAGLKTARGKTYGYTEVTTLRQYLRRNP